MNYIIKNHTETKSSQPKRYGVVKVAQDVHARFYVSCLQEEGQQPKAPRKMDPLTHLTWVAKLVAQSEKVYSCYEAGPTGFALHRQLTAMGVENIVVVPSRLDENGKRVNNDKTDTMNLAVRLDRFIAGNKKSFTTVRVPTQEEEQRRVWPRQRKQFQETRLACAAQGRALVLTQGIAINNMWWMETAWKGLQKYLEPWLVSHLEAFRSVILKINEEIKKIDQKIKADCKANPKPKPKWAGEISMETIESEVCDWNRFGSWRKTGSYSGLTGGVSSSGTSRSDLSITKVGNRRLRTALIEMAWRMALHQPNYWLSKKWAHVLGPKAKSHARGRKKAIVAYARQLFVDLWRWKTGRITAEHLGWEMA